MEGEDGGEGHFVLMGGGILWFWWVVGRGRGRGTGTGVMVCER